MMALAMGVEEEDPLLGELMSSSKELGTSFGQIRGSNDGISFPQALCTNIGVNASYHKSFVGSFNVSSLGRARLINAEMIATPLTIAIAYGYSHGFIRRFIEQLKLYPDPDKAQQHLQWAILAGGCCGEVDLVRHDFIPLLSSGWTLRDQSLLVAAAGCNSVELVNLALTLDEDGLERFGTVAAETAVDVGALDALVRLVDLGVRLDVDRKLLQRAIRSRNAGVFQVLARNASDAGVLAGVVCDAIEDEEDNLARFEMILEVGADPSVDIPELLVEKGKLETMEKWSGPVGAYFVAAQRARMDLLRLFLGRGLDPNVVDGRGRSVLVHALRARTSAMECSWNPKFTNDERYRPLVVEGQENNDLELETEIDSRVEGCVRMLLEAGVDVNGGKESPLLVALEESTDRVLDMLVEAGATFGVEDDPKRLLLAAIARDPSSRFVREILETRGVPRGTFSAACRSGRGVVEMLLEFGVDVNDVCDEDDVPLIVAVEEGEEEIVQLLIEAGADVNLENEEGETALCVACQMQPHFIPFLLEAGSDPNHADDDSRWTPLMHAVCNGAPEQYIRLLLETGAEVDARNVDGETALMMAALDGSKAIMKLLVEAGARVDVSSDNDHDLLDCIFANANRNVLKDGATLKRTYYDNDANETELIYLCEFLVRDLGFTPTNVIPAIEVDNLPILQILLEHCPVDDHFKVLRECCCAQSHQCFSYLTTVLGWSTVNPETYSRLYLKHGRIYWGEEEE